MFNKKSQKILVPKGTIDPDEDTVIEIPIALKGQPIIVARKQGRADDSLSISRSLYSSISGETFPVRTSSTLSRPQETLWYSSQATHQPLGNLDQTELAEKQLVHSRLEEFQQARRQFLLETANVATKSTQVSPSDQLSGLHRTKAISNPSFHSTAIYDNGKMMESSIIKPRHTKSVPLDEHARELNRVQSSTGPSVSFFNSSAENEHDSVLCLCPSQACSRKF
ncbi:uncharacterized protein LOC132696991 [Cylas formicarius]|uniref:uncharacterized protein LOC132696991 n=1 Tax=Cylas formicarius TaxID=197179 RepID=UPI0029583D23|nr:uncharacterized protein LOC132696991 [Cylas formicarius]